VPGRDLARGLSITDACLSWEDSVRLLDRLATAVRTRRTAKSPGVSRGTV
jgi:3-deoxy-7-phosphoheptulonate synthase